MTITVSPLEKQLVNLDLAKGMDERTRPELLGGITRIENLVQDQTGSWTKRPGTSKGFVSDASGTGAAPVFPKKVLQLVDGWAVIADGGRLLHKQDQQVTLRARQYHMDLSVYSASYAGSSGPSVQSTFAGANVEAVASGTYHDAYVMKRNTFSAGTTTYKLTIVERSSGVEYSYDFSRIPWALSGPNREARAAFVGGRYLHVYATVGLGGTSQNLQLIVIDTFSALPANEATIVPVTVNLGNCTFSDVTAGATYSYVLWFDTTGAVAQLSNYDVNGTLVTTVTVPTGSTALSLNETTAQIWSLIPNAASASLASWDSATLAAGTASYATTKPGTYISSDSVTNEMYLVYAPAIASGATFGANTIAEIRVSTIATPGAAAVYKGGMYGWRVVSSPFFMSGPGRHYIHLVKGDVETGAAPTTLTTIGEIATSVICDLSTFTQFYSNTAALALPYGSYRLACCLEPYVGLARLGASSGMHTWRYIPRSATEVAACVPYQTFRATSGIGFYQMRTTDVQAYGSCSFGGSTHIAHGGLNSYDGRNLVECGIVDQPVAKLAVTAAAGNLSGSYRYYCVFRHTDGNGAAAMGRVYGPLSAVNVAAATGRNDFVIQPHAVTNRDTGKADSVPVVDVYRTKSGGTQFYLVASSQELGFFGGTTLPNVTSVQANTTTGLLTFQDNISDTLLGANPIMYRQPGTTNSAADRYAAPACQFVVQHKDRLFCADPYGQRVYYSSFFVDGESPWFNPGFNFFVHQGSGPITALASMDGRLFVFKRDAVFVVDGDGPGEAGPTGNEFSPPQSLAVAYGCIDHRSVVVTPKGIMYRSLRGIELLTRSLALEWVGERIDSTVDAYPITTGSCIESESRVRWTLTDINDGTYYRPGVEIVYDMPSDSWSIARYTGGAGGLYFIQNIATVLDAGVSKVVYADSYVGVWMLADTTSYLDSNGWYVPFVIESGWIKQGPQARQRVSDILFLAKKHTGANHALKMSLAYNYSDTYTQTFTWEPGQQPAGIEELNIQPATQQVLAIRVKIEDQAPADTGTYPVGTGGGCDILSITAEVAPKMGAPKLAAGQKA